MSAVYEVEPKRCPECRVPWSEPGTMLRSGDAVTGHDAHPKLVELRPTNAP